jgi:hypothetical protein
MYAVKGEGVGQAAKNGGAPSYRRFFPPKTCRKREEPRSEEII